VIVEVADLVEEDNQDSRLPFNVVEARPLLKTAGALHTARLE